MRTFTAAIAMLRCAVAQFASLLSAMRGAGTGARGGAGRFSRCIINEKCARHHIAARGRGLSLLSRRIHGAPMRKHTLALAAAALPTATLAVATTHIPAQGAGSAVTISPEDLQRQVDGRSLPLTYIEELY